MNEPNVNLELLAYKLDELSTEIGVMRQEMKENSKSFEVVHDKIRKEYVTLLEFNLRVSKLEKVFYLVTSAVTLAIVGAVAALILK